MLDPATSSRSVRIRQLGDWSEASCDNAGGTEGPRTVFCEHVITGGVWSAVVKIVASKDDREGGIFVGIAPEKCSPSVPLGDRNAGIGWGKAMPYVLWTADVQSKQPGQTYPFYLEASSVKMQQRHYTFDYSIDDVCHKLHEWGYGHYSANFRAARVDGLKLLEFADASLEKEVGMSDAGERAHLLSAIRTFFNSQHAYVRNDIVRLTVDMDTLPASLTLFRRQGDSGAWRQVGKPILMEGKGGRSAGWRFAVTLYSPYDVIHFWSCKGTGETPPRLQTMKKGGQSRAASEAWGGPGASSCLRSGRELPEGSLSHWRYLRGGGDGKFADAQFLVLYHLACGVILELPERGQTGLLMQAALPPSLHAGDAYKIPSAAASRHVLAVSPPDCLEVSSWRAPGLIRRVLQDFAAVAADPATVDVAAAAGAEGWARGEGCTAASQRRLGSGVKGMQLLGADEGMEWHELGEKASTRANKIGLEWKNGWEEALAWKSVGSSRPNAGAEIENVRLRDALHRKTEFAPDEFAQFGISDLQTDSFIKVGDTYFKPSADELQPPCAGQWVFAKEQGTASSLQPGALRLGVAQVCERERE